MFAVGKYPVTYKPQSESGSSKDLYIRMVLGFSEAPNIDIYINPHNSVVSSDKFEALQLKLDDYALKDFSNAAEHQKLPDYKAEILKNGIICPNTNSQRFPLWMS